MRNRRTILVTTTVVGVAAAVAVGAVAVGAGSSAGYSYGSTPSATSGNGPVTLHTVTASVQGTERRILVDAKGEPLYTYAHDTATTSRVAGQLAALWPPLVGRTPTARGAAGDLSTVSTANGSQVAYNGRFLYTFVQDKPGQVTGQGVQDFFVATPGTGPVASTGGGSASRGY